MEKQKLNALLEQLHQEIERADSLDEKTREKIITLQTDIRALLERSGSHQPASLLLRLEEAITHLEVDHPTLAVALGQLLAALSNAGI
jgi:hypothetical protein